MTAKKKVSRKRNNLIALPKAKSSASKKPVVKQEIKTEDFLVPEDRTEIILSLFEDTCTNLILQQDGTKKTSPYRSYLLWDEITNAIGQELEGGKFELVFPSNPVGQLIIRKTRS